VSKVGTTEPQSLAEIHAALAAAELGDLPAWRVTLLRNVTLETMAPYLRYHAWRAGLNATVSFGEFDNIVQEAHGGDAEGAIAASDCVVIALKLEQLLPELHTGFAALDPDQHPVEQARVLELLRTVLQGLRRQTQSMLLLHAFEPPADPAYGALDRSLPGGQLAFIDALNAGLRDLCSDFAGCYLVDTPSLALRTGTERWYDQRFWSAGRAPYSGIAMDALAREYLKFVRAQRGAQKKVLVLDCDNTLWGGIIGEDGLQGIKLGNDHPGSVYKRFQQEIVGLAKRGTIIALCSKNNEEDVWEVFEQHPDMVLKKAPHRGLAH